MKKLWLGILIFFLFTISMAAVQAAMTVSVSSASPLTAKPGDTVTFTYSITNTVASAFTATVASSKPETSITGQSKVNTPSISPISVAASAGQGGTPATTGQFSIVLPSTLSGTYTATLNVSEQTSPGNSAVASYSFVVDPVSTMDITESSLLLTATRGKSVSQEVTVKNTGSNSFTSFTTTHDLKLNDSEENKITLTFSNPGTITPGGSEPKLKVTASVPDGMKLGEYKGIVNVSSSGISDTFELTLNVNPELCELGVKGNIVKINIDQPDNNDDFKPGEEFDVNVEVKNNANDDRDFIVEVFLWNLDENDEVDSQESDSLEIQDGDTEDFPFNFVMPTDESDFGASDSFAIYVKAYEDGEEDSQCNEDFVEIDGTRENKEVKVTGFAITPSVAVCSQNVNLQVTVENSGKKEDKIVDVIVRSNELGLDLRSEKFALDAFDESDNSAIKSFTFKLPEDAELQEYTIESIVNYDSGKKQDSEFAKLTINRCGTSTGTTTPGSEPTITEFNLVKSTLEAKPGILEIPFTITNAEANTIVYTVELSAEGNWASATSTQVLVKSGETKSDKLVVVTDDVEGTFTGTVNLKQESTVVAKQPFIVTLTEAAAPTGSVTFQPTNTPSSFYRNWVESGRVFWVIGLVILVILIIFFLRLIFRSE